MLVLVLTAVWLSLRTLNGRVPTPPHVGLTNGTFKPIADRPNWVASLDADAAHHVNPLRGNGDLELNREHLKLALVQTGGRLVREESNYFHHVFRTPLLGFVDDVEFLLPPDGHAVHVRSASRIGHSDLGANRRRVERIRQAWESVDLVR
ncbi:MAG TPA: DUF1499 domain-containing protein [Verrucomicrobiota bacterium]|nr:DUF1499 domain-containing protein [Verrucomicrobiota bacterium]